MQTLEHATVFGCPPTITTGAAAAVVEAITAAGYDIVRRPLVEPPARSGVRRATFGHGYLVDEAGDGSGYRRPHE